MIALVVTIIVLLILAGVSISMLTGQNGILNRASETKEKTEVAKQDESDKMVEMEAMVQTAGTAIKNPSSYGQNPNAQATADGAGKYFALPDGAKYINGTVDTGIVVEIKESYFVWIPVDDVVLDKERINELPTSSENGTLRGKTYTPMSVKIGNDYKGILYDTMIESVKKYKGFYIAQYEAGIDTSTTDKSIVFKDASKDSNITTVDASNSLTSSWYGLYKKIKTFATIENREDKVVSNMIWGSQYDAMMNWMAKTGNEVGKADETKRNTGRVTGSSITDVINNVYDLYGCRYEWTLEAYSTRYRAERGGDYNDSSSSANRNGNDPNVTTGNYSSRATLYIK